MRLPLQEASAKVRTGGPLDDDEDYELPVWAGTIDLRLVAGTPKPDERLLPDVKCPSYVAKFTRARTREPTR